MVGTPPNRSPMVGQDGRAAPAWQRFFSEFYGRLITPGVFYIPSQAGAPTGTPTAKTGLVAMSYDTSNDDLYVYNGSWKKVTLS